MSSYTPHMEEDHILYRGVLAYEQEPTEWVTNPNYDPTGMSKQKNSWRQKIRVVTGPDETITDIIGPYNSMTPIKGYVTRNRGHKKNLRIVRFERITGWEEVKD